MRFVSLASGSSGNAALVSTENTNILVDCGISAKKADETLKSLGLEGGLEEIDALLLTHEHSDHIRGVKRLMSAWSIPVYATDGTLSSLARASGDEYFNYAGRSLMEAVSIDFEFTVGDIAVLPFGTYHDAADPCGFRFEAGGGRTGSRVSAAVLTDCGHYDDYIADRLSELDALLLEANHDRRMLVSGPYPMALKRRIMSARGHMSNTDAGELLAGILSPRLKQVLLGHLSKENNTPEAALETVAAGLAAGCGPEAAERLRLFTAPRDGLSRVMVIE